MLFSHIPLALFLLVHFQCALSISHLRSLPPISSFLPCSIQTSSFYLFCHVFYFLYSFFSSFPSSLLQLPFPSYSFFLISIPIPQFLHFCLPPLALAHCSGVGCEDSWLFVVLRKHLLTSETSSLALDRWEPSLFPAGTISCLLPKPQWQLLGSDVETSPLLHQLLGPQLKPPRC